MVSSVSTMGLGSPAISGPEVDPNDEAEARSGLGSSNDIEFSLHDVRAALRRNRILLASGLIVGLILGVLLAMLAQPEYEATASVQIDQQAPQVLGAGTADVNAVDADQAYLMTQLQLLTSASLADRVARSLKYYQTSVFFDKMQKDAPTAQRNSAQWKRAVVGLLRANLSATLKPGTRIVDIKFTSPDPVTAQAVANTVAEQFISSTLSRRFERSDYSRKFLEEQILQTRVRLENSERALIAFAQSRGITDVSVGANSSAGASGGGSQSLTMANLTALNEAYAKAKSDRILAQEKWEEARNRAATSVQEVISSSAVQALQAAKNQKAVELQSELERHSATYPTVVQLQSAITALDNQIKREAAKVRDTIQQQYQLALRQENELKEQVDQLRAESLDEQGRGVQLSILRRDADTNRQLYDGLLQRFREVNAAAGVTINNISVIDKAEKPSTPIWPKPLLSALTGALVGFVMAIVAALLRERFDDRVRTPDEVERKLRLPLLGITPYDDATTVQASLNDPKSTVSEAMYSLVSNIRLATPTGVPHVLQLTSTQAREGKSTTAYAIARELAQSGARTLLVDCDLRRPSVHSFFDAENKVGFSNLVTAGQFDDSFLLPESGHDNLSVMYAGPLPPSPPRLLAPEILKPVFEDLASRFDNIIVDGPPVLGLADAQQIASIANGTLFILEAGASGQGQTKAAIRRLMRGNARLIGVALTKLRASRDGYGYGYSYYDTYYSYSSEK